MLFSVPLGEGTHGAMVYSWMRPPNTSWRRTVAALKSPTACDGSSTSVRRSNPPCPRTSAQSRHSARSVPTHRSQRALALGAPDRRQDDPHGVGPKHRGERPGEVSRSWIKNLEGRPSSLRGHGQVTGLLGGDPGRVWVCCGSPDEPSWLRLRSISARTAFWSPREDVASQHASHLVAGTFPYGGRPRCRVGGAWSRSWSRRPLP